MVDKNEGEQADVAGSESIVRPAILVHSAEDGKPVTFLSSDGEVHFDAARIERIVANHNAMITALAEQYGGFDKMPVGAFPPILDMHNDQDSNDRIVGRLFNLLEVKVMDVPGVGKNVTCAVTKILFLGKGTVEKVKDGRIYHLSIGIDEKTDTLGETSTVIEPAAPGAMLLSKGKKEQNSKGGFKMSKALARLQASREKRLAKLGEINSGLTKLTTKLTQSSEQVRLMKIEGDVTHRLTKLMRSAKLTPAEFKRMDVKKLSKLPQEALDTLMESYDNREPVIEPGQRGSSDATTFSEVGKNLEKAQMKRLKAELRGDLKRLSGGKVKFSEGEEEDADHGKDHEMKKKMKSLAGGNDIESENPGKDPHSVAGQEGDEEQLKHMKHLWAEHSKHMSECQKHMEAGDQDKMKEHHELAMKHMGELHKCFGDGHDDKKEMSRMSVGVGDVKSEDYKASMDQLQSQIDELSTQMARFGGAVEELMAAEKDEGESYSEMAEEHESLKNELKAKA